MIPSLLSHIFASKSTPTCILICRGGCTVLHRGPPTPMTSVEPVIPHVISPWRTPVKSDIDPGNYAAQSKEQRAIGRKSHFVDEYWINKTSRLTAN
jgi:hypothetical protein